MNIADIAARRYTTKVFDAGRRIPAPQMEQLESLLRLAPSSINSQPWHFFIAGSEEGRARVAKAASGPYGANGQKIRDASHVVVLCARTDFGDKHLEHILAQEERDGRFANAEAKEATGRGRGFYVNLHRERQDTQHWMEKQVYIALGTLLFGAAALEIDACPMEGFDPVILDEELGLHEKGLTSVVLTALGYRAGDDFNASLPKSRFPEDELITRL